MRREGRELLSPTAPPSDTEIEHKHRRPSLPSILPDLEVEFASPRELEGEEVLVVLEVFPGELESLRRSM